MLGFLIFVLIEINCFYQLVSYILFTFFSGMLGIHRIIFFGKTSCIKIYNKNTYCNIRLFGNVVSRRILNQNLHSYLTYGKFKSQNLIDIKTYVKCLSCSSRYARCDKKDKDQSNVSNNKPVNKIVYVLKRFRFIAEVFWNGCKNLFRDVRIALRTRRKLGLYHQRDYSKLTREEVRHMNQVSS